MNLVNRHRGEGGKGCRLEPGHSDLDKDLTGWQIASTMIGNVLRQVGYSCFVENLDIITKTFHIF
jgi:hypothetical protein